MKALLCAVFLTISSPSFAQNDSVIFLVRHAERTSQGGDNALLNAVGEQRAKCLAQTLERAGIAEIYVTEIRRTQQTAAPLAEELHLQPKIVPRDDVAGLVKDLKGAGNGKVLVVAHADTLPKILAQLGAGTLPESKPNEQHYDYLVIVPVRDGKAALLNVIRYCPATE
jgi:broad specificity phosphatase PhoE